jgi:prepilin-type N-terminal cleavage/methylation domain-containing protein
MFQDPTTERGFTLIELSIVLVIIGLIVGGVLVGQDLIRAAQVRAQVTQIEKYNTAVNTFRDKYGGLPGDLNATAASNFGFAARGQYAGEGDGNGLIEGMNGNNNPGSNFGFCITGGETAMFWVDLSQARLIEGSFTAASETAATNPTSANFDTYFPTAKITGNYISVVSGGWPEMLSAQQVNTDGRNYFELEGFKDFSTNCFPDVNLALTVAQAYAIDTKMDDGLPQSGNVLALIDDTYIMWPGNGTISGPFTTATAGSATSCFDNGNVAGVAQQYSMKQNGGSGANCGLTFGFQ